MKGQITKHEWYEISGSTDKCPHCEALRLHVIDGSFLYRRKELVSFRKKKPRCITRKIQADGDSTAT